VGADQVACRLSSSLRPPRVFSMRFRLYAAAAKLISVCAPRSPRSRKRGCPKIRYFKLANGCSAVARRSRIASGVARCCIQPRNPVASPTSRAPSLSRATLHRQSSTIRAVCANERLYGSVRGVPGNWYPYRDRRQLFETTTSSLSASGGESVSSLGTISQR